MLLQLLFALGKIENNTLQSAKWFLTFTCYTFIFFYFLPLVEKYQWQNSWWQTSKKLKVPNCVGLVFYRHQCIYWCLLPIVNEWKNILPWQLQVLVTLQLCFCILTVSVCCGIPVLVTEDYCRQKPQHIRRTLACRIQYNRGGPWLCQIIEKLVWAEAPKIHLTPGMVSMCNS